MSHIVVIGAGYAGLAAACHLVGRGHRVTVVEPESGPGGRSGTLQQDGFTFDTGPTVLTMVELIDEALAAVGGSVADALTLHRLDPAYRAVYADGSTLQVRAGHEAMKAEIARVSGAKDAAAFDPFVDWLTELCQIELPTFIDTNFDHPGQLLRNPRAAARLLRMGGFDRLGRQIRRRFDDDRLHRIFSFQAMYAGLSPDDALAIYAVITYMDSIAGVYFPEGGVRAVPQAMADAAAAAGATFRYGESVSRLLRRPDGTVVGVELAGRGGGSAERVAADAVVCTIDLPHAYETLLADLRPPRALKRPKYSPSAAVWHVGVRGTPRAGLAHHNIHFGREWSQAFDDLLKAGTLMRDPSRLVCLPSMHDSTAAPAGGSTLYVLEPVPNLATGRLDWAREAGPLRDRLAGVLAAGGYPDDIVTERLVTPVDWHRQGMAAGTPFALAHTFAQTGPFRPGNVTRQAPGLVFAGSGTVPGVGIPMVLISGKLAADRVEQVLHGR